VIVGNFPEGLKKDAEMYAGCVSGAIDKDEYISIVKRQGFSGITVQTEKEIVLSDETLLNHVTPDELEEFKQSGGGIFSITLFAVKMG
jgi:hypothetical protein